ncbi:MAG: M81 family metallopeptidase [Pseudomonadota bacterium]|nr:M81 family metallopeptidase [Pseudomonadota bacterium]
MKVFVAGALHESHSFNSVSTPLLAFEDAEPGSILCQPGLADTRSTEGGILTAARAFGWDLCFPFFAKAAPSGPVAATAYDTLRMRLLDELQKSMPVDGVILALHGSMFAETCPDTEGDMAAAVRAVIGPDVPLALTLDCHANVSDLMVQSADIITSYRTTPHTDQRETAERAAQLLDDAMQGRTKPRCHIGRLPMMAGLDMGRTVDPKGPMARLHARARQIEAQEGGVLEICLNAGFYYGDIAETGPSVVVTGDGGDARFQKIADDLIHEAWETRDYFSLTFLTGAQAVAKAAADQPGPGAGPMILVDFTDGPFGGAHSDGTELLSLLLKADLPGTVIGPILDPEAVAKAAQAGPGATITLDVGGKTDPTYGGPPVTVMGQISALNDGTYLRKGAYLTGTTGRMGNSACITSGNCRIVVISQRQQPEDREQYRIFGIDPEQANIIALKGQNHFRADFEPIARELVFVDTGCLVAVDYTVFPWKNIRRPIWPLDDVTLPPR